MKTLIVYDSAYGNTERIAQAIAAALDARSIRAADAGSAELLGVDLLVVGSPTQGGRPTKALTGFLNQLPRDALTGKAVAAFDTRIAAPAQGLPLRLLMRLIGFAAPRIAAGLKTKGGQLISAPEGFIVQGTEGPLAAGELERATAWARQLETAAGQTVSRESR
jgi:flavodoxin